MMQSTNLLLEQACNCLSDLIDSVFLDATEMANDCLEVFKTYEWQPGGVLDDSEKQRWTELLRKGNAGEMNSVELSEFLELTDPDSQVHPYYFRIQARKIIASIQKHQNDRKPDRSQPSIEIASKAAAANCLFDLGSGERNARAAKALSPATIFDAIQLTSALTISVDGSEYVLEPYWPCLSQDDALAILEDMKVTIESELVKQYKAFAQQMAAAEVDSSKYRFTLRDECESKERDINGFIDNSLNHGIALHFSGYSDLCSMDDNGTPVYIEKYDGELRVIVYSDINQEDPTHVISLEGARNEKRTEE